MPATLAPSLFTRLLASGSRPRDDAEKRLEKALVILAGGLVCIALALRQALQGALALTPEILPTLLCEGLLAANFAIYQHTRAFVPFRSRQFALILLGPFLIILRQDDFLAAAGLFAWAQLAPVGVMLAVGVRQSRPWFGAWLTLTALGTGAASMGADQPVTSGTLLSLALDLCLAGIILYLLLLYALSEKARTRERLQEAHRQLHREQERSESLLLNILPAPVAARLKQGGEILADDFPEVVVMFADIVDFTRIASDMEAVEVFAMLNRVFCRFDELAEEHGLERIKTIGDAYMVAGGLHAHPDTAHAAMASLAFAMQVAMQDTAVNAGLHLELRIGIACGPVVAGVVGHGKFIYDLWGDTVNLAHRLCSEGEPNQIQCDTRMFERIKSRFVFARPVLLLLKGKGYVPAYRLASPRIFAMRAARNPPAPRAA